MMPLLVLRPQPGADATAARARALGLDPIVAPLFVVHPIDHDFITDHGLPEALLMTSAAAPRLLQHRAAALSHLPVYAVGAATGAAARAAGFRRVICGAGDGAAIVERAAADGVRHLLHLAGREHRALAHPAMLIGRVTVYAADAVPALPALARDALAGDVVAMLHSPRAAARFAHLLNECACPRSRIALAAISAAAAHAAGTGWRTIEHAMTPDDAALLAVAARLCEEGR